MTDVSYQGYIQSQPDKTILTMNRKESAHQNSTKGESRLPTRPTASDRPREAPTSSGVSLPSGCVAAARRARFPARMLLRLICLSGGGPPRGCPRTMMAHPERTYTG